MLKKRLIGVITVKDGMAVQSFEYRRYFPLGRPAMLAENLDRWAADEILIQCIDRSSRQLGPDLQTIREIASTGITTPLTYSGGIRDYYDAETAIGAGADRIAVDNILHQSPSSIVEISHSIGAQAIIASLPISYDRGSVYWYNYITRESKELSPELTRFITKDVISEVMIIDWLHEGGNEKFDSQLIDNMSYLNLPLIAFGGISSATLMDDLLKRDVISAVAIGNSLNYKENQIHNIRREISNKNIRKYPA